MLVTRKIIQTFIYSQLCYNNPKKLVTEFIYSLI